MVAAPLSNLSPETLLGSGRVGSALLNDRSQVLAINKVGASYLNVRLDKLLADDSLPAEALSWVRDGFPTGSTVAVISGRALEFSLVWSQGNLFQINIEDVTERMALLAKLADVDTDLQTDFDSWNRTIRLSHSLKLLMNFESGSSSPESVVALIETIGRDLFPAGGCLHRIEDRSFSFLTSWGKAPWQVIGGPEECILTATSPSHSCEHLGNRDGTCTIAGKTHFTVAVDGTSHFDSKSAHLFAETIDFVLG